MGRLSTVSVCHRIHMAIPLCGRGCGLLPCAGVQAAVHTGVVTGVQLQSLVCARSCSVEYVLALGLGLRVGVVVFIISLCSWTCIWFIIVLR